MVLNIVTVGEFIGVLPSAIFVYLEVGRYASPQVPRSLFDERKELFSYTAGLFVGAILAVLFILLEGSVNGGGLVSAILWLVVLVAVLELAQTVLARSVYFGSDNALPFYVIGLRSGGAGLLGIVIFAAYLSRPPFTAAGVLGSMLEAVAFVLLLIAAGIQSSPRGPPGSRVPGSLGRGVILEVVGFLLLAFGPLGGDAGVLVAAIATGGGSLGIYLRLRDEVLGSVRPPPREDGPDGGPPTPKGRFGRLDGDPPS